MFKSIAKILGGDPVARQLESYAETAQMITLLEPEMRLLSDAELQAKTEEFRQRLADGEDLEDILVEAYAVVRETSIRTIGLRHFDVQLIGGIILHEGKITEMRTGEGKTLVATLPIYLNTLRGEGVRLVTVNDYLARRDARWMGPVFHFLGLSVGVLQEAARTEGGRKAFLYDPERESVQEDIHQLILVDRAEAYAADVTYGTNNEFGFDYLRDNMARRLEDRAQRGHHFAILDEVDNILIDEARTPLIISGPSSDNPEQYIQMAKIVKQLQPEDYEINERDRTIALTEIGEDHAERLIGTSLRDPDRPEDITPEQARILGHLEQALRADFLFKRNKDYVVQGGRVIIVDDFTGRLMAGRRWSDGLHQAVEAKEGVKVRQENVTYATITLQNYFRMYSKLSGMTGTAVTEAEEFKKIYNVDVIPLPTNLAYIASLAETELVEVEYRDDGNKFIYYGRKGEDESQPIFWTRKDYPDVVFRTEEAKLRAVTREILERHVIGQPVLVGTTSVELSEKISRRLKAELIRRLMSTLILREVYLEVNELPDEGMKIEALDHLYQPLEMVSQSTIRQFAKELDINPNPVHADNLERLAAILGLEDNQVPRLGEILQSGIPHNVLNAKKHDEESRIIADAGAFGGVTIATNMAGRGVDIKLGGEIAEEVLAAVNRILRRARVPNPENLNMDERLQALGGLSPEEIGIYDSEASLFRAFIEDGKQVKIVGGLHVLGSERHEARRIDNQLRGRAARQGDPGSSQFFLSLEDELMRLFGGSQVSNLMQRLNIDDAVPIAHNIVNRVIEQSQTRVEGANFDTRKHLLEYDDVLNQQREVFYNQRNRVFEKDELYDDIIAMLEEESRRRIDLAIDDPDGYWKLLAWLEEVQPTINLNGERPYPSFMMQLLIDSLAEVNEKDELKEALIEIVNDALRVQYEFLARAVDDQLEASMTRLDDQVRQRVDMAEMAIEGAELEAEEQGTSVNIRTLLQTVESVAGLQIQIEKNAETQLDPAQLKDKIPELIEASLGLRVWAGIVQSIEQRLGEKLSVDQSLSVPIDWDQAENDLMDAFEQTYQNRVDNLVLEITNELERAIGDAVIDDRLKLHLLIQMSFGQRTYFDRKSHQKKSVSIARFSYANSAAYLLDGLEPEALEERIIEHLINAQNAIQKLLGQAEFNRLASSNFELLEEKQRAAIEIAVDDASYKQITGVSNLGSLSEPLKKLVRDALGQMLVVQAHRALLLSVGDRLWIDYLTQIEALRTSIGLEAYGQRDPLVQYKSKAFDMFHQLLSDVRAGVILRIFRIQTSSQSASAGTRPKTNAQPKRPKKRKRNRKRRSKKR